MSGTSGRYAPEVRQRAVWLVLEHEDEHEVAVGGDRVGGGMVGCTAETLRTWVRRSEIDEGRRRRVISSERGRLWELERENSELRRANEIV